MRTRHDGGPDARRERGLRERYGITSVEYEFLLGKQGGRCAICQRLPRTQRLAVDHDHTLHGKASVRGLLCMTCNRSLEYVVGAHERVALLHEEGRCACAHCRYWNDPPAMIRGRVVAGTPS